MTWSALMKFNTWARSPEIDGLLEREAQWILTEAWEPPNSLVSKGGSPRRNGQAQNISSHGRLMACEFERTGDPFYLVAPEEMVASGFGKKAKSFGTRDTGLVYNYLPWFLAELNRCGHPVPDPKLQATLTPASLRLKRGEKTTVTATLKNDGDTAIEDLRFSLHARRDLKIVRQPAGPGTIPPGKSVTITYQIEAPKDLNASCDYNRIAYAQWSALFRRAGQAQLAHATVRIEL
jgi:hypothetical protein